ncbi:type II toxin-antitoxin system Phd/YefM family antitoxin [Microbacterium sp. NPDC089987]|uniref:type II toxin-antitoxin system Phd/YefM family antitoxin n=1 Tax=Microbacterium sp. NPDC089987 TaxID=3364202 RepID=UPI00380B76A7
MTLRLSLRELRQNPTAAINALEGGEAIVITRRSKPIADLVPHGGRAVTAGATPAHVAALLSRHADDSAWAAELAAERAEEIRDAWGDDA